MATTKTNRFDQLKRKARQFGGPFAFLYGAGVGFEGGSRKNQVQKMPLDAAN
jgi:hypothetical protein